MSSIEKTLARVNERINDRQFYDAHQAVRTVAARYVRQKAYDNAIALLYSSSLLLCRAGQVGSVADLLTLLLDVFSKAGIQVDSISRGRLAQIIWQLDPCDPVVKQIATQVDNWTAKAGAPATGDPDLHHVFGTLYARAHMPYEAEPHLLLGTRESAEVLADLHREWYLQDKGDPVLYVSRGVFGYLSNQDIRSARAYLDKALGDLAAASDEPIETENGIYAFDDHIMLNFLQLLVPVCQLKEAVLYRQLATHYSPKKYEQWAKALAQVEEVYFNIVPNRGMNIMDLMGGMFR